MTAERILSIDQLKSSIVLKWIKVVLNSSCWPDDEDVRFYINVHIDSYNTATFQLKTLCSECVLGLDFCHMADVRVFLALVRPLIQVSC